MTTETKPAPDAHHADCTPGFLEPWGTTITRGACAGVTSRA